MISFVTNLAIPASQRTTAVVPTTRACGMGGFQISNATIPMAATPNHQISKTRKLVIPGCAVIRFTTNPCRGVIARRNSHSKAGINGDTSIRGCWNFQ